MTQEKVQNAKIAMASVTDSIHDLHEYDGNFHTLMTLLTVSMSERKYVYDLQYLINWSNKPFHSVPENQLFSHILNMMYILFLCKVKKIQAIFKLVHSEESKLEKASFTGSCYALGNPKAAVSNVKASYQKCLNAWNQYYKTMLMCAWDNMNTDHSDTKEKILSTLETQGEESFLKELRFVLFKCHSNWCAM